MSISSVLGQFRQHVYQKFRRRADAALDLGDALTTAGVVASPVALSEEPPFRRTFSMVYDVPENGDGDLQELGQVLYESQPADCETLAGYCALAYWQLLLMRQDVEDLRPAWQPRMVRGEMKPLTPGQVQRGGGLRFLRKVGSPAAAPRPAGKGRGRAPGYHPAPRPRYPVLRKGQNRPPKAQKQAPNPL